jgi:hypothetical protein
MHSGAEIIEFRRAIRTMKGLLRDVEEGEGQSMARFAVFEQE